MVNTVKKEFCPEVYQKLNSWVNRCGSDRAFANRIAKTTRTVRELVNSNSELIERFGFTKPTGE